MALRVPGQSRGRSGSGTSKPTPLEPLTLDDWSSEATLPSLLLLGPSGSGKSHGIAQLINAGFKVGYVEIEPKVMSVGRHKPKHINLCKPVGGQPPTDAQRYVRLLQLRDGLRKGKYRTAEDGSAIDILAFDGLTEAGDLIYAAKVAAHTKDKTTQMWGAVGNDLIKFFRECRDAAGIASTRLGLPPIGIVATCGEASPKRFNMKEGSSYIDRDQPVLPGNMSLVKLPFVFEVIWRLDGGLASDDTHEFRVYTSLGETFFAKSPGGIHPHCVAGPGGVDNPPDIGVMYRELLTNEASPYFNPERAPQQ